MLQAKEDTFLHKVRELFIEIGIPRLYSQVYVLYFSEENTWVAFANKNYVLPLCITQRKDLFLLDFEKGIDTAEVNRDASSVCICVTMAVGCESMGSVVEFWKSNVPYTSNSGLTAFLLKDTFRPSLEMQNGFAYNVQLSDTKRLTFRGHGRDFEAQYAMICKSNEMLQRLLNESRQSITDFLSKSKSHIYKVVQCAEKMEKTMSNSIEELDTLKCPDIIAKVKALAEKVTLAKENGLDTSEQIRKLEANLYLLNQSYDTFCQPELLAKGIKELEKQINECKAAVSDFKNKVLDEAGYKKASDAVMTLKTSTETFGDMIVGSKINCVNGNVVRVYLEEQLAAEDMTYHCTQVLLPTVYSYIKTTKLETEFIKQASLTFKKVLEFMPQEMDKMVSIRQELYAVYQNLQCYENFSLGNSFDLFSSGYKSWQSSLKEYAVYLLNQWFDHYSNRKGASKHSYSESVLKVAIMQANTLEQFYMASDITSLRENVIHFHNTENINVENLLLFDHQMYLVLTSSIISLCQSHKTDSKEFIMLVCFTAQRWTNVKRFFGPLKKRNSYLTSLKKMVKFCSIVQSLVSVLTQWGKETSILALQELDHKINSLKPKLNETGRKFQAMLSEFKSDQYLEGQFDSDTVGEIQRPGAYCIETLPDRPKQIINQFSEDLEEVTVLLAECKDNIAAIVKPYEDKDTKDYTTAVSNLIELLKCFRLTQRYETKQVENITDFITWYENSDAFSKDSNNILKEAKSDIEKAKRRLGNTKGMGKYEAALSRDALDKLKEAEATLKQDYLGTILDKLEAIAPNLCDKTETPRLVELLKTIQDKNQNKRKKSLQDELISHVISILDEKEEDQISVEAIVSLNGLILKLLKHAQAFYEQPKLRICWAKYMMPTFRQAHDQLREVAFAKDMSKLRKAGKHFSLHLVRREWVHTRLGYATYYCWNGDRLCIDPYNIENDTHILCEQSDDVLTITD
ncbi:uncharacterized protein LOC113474789 [Ciona intestinalis]